MTSVEVMMMTVVASSAGAMIGNTWYQNQRVVSTARKTLTTEVTMYICHTEMDVRAANMYTARCSGAL
jgi:hypothetical protein